MEGGSLGGSVASHAASLALGAGVGAAAAYWLSRRTSALDDGFQLHLDGAAAAGAAPPADGGAAAGGAGAAARRAGPSVARFEDDPILAEQLTRNVQFLGLDGQRAVSSAFAVVVGLGGVGSHAAAMLARSGLGRLRLVDFDQVSLSSLNRHAVATRADVGTPKAACLARHLALICPEADVEARCEMYTPEAEARLLAGGPDLVIDAIDNIDTKVALVAACVRRGVPVLCVSGAGAKADPTRLRFADVAESAADPLARAVRHRLRRDHGIASGVTVLLSAERPRCGLVFAPEEHPMARAEDGGGAAAPGGAQPHAAALLDFQVVPNFRVRTIPVLGPVPAAFGLAAAAWALARLAGAPLPGEPLFRVPRRDMQTQVDRLVAREAARFGAAAGDAVDAAEVEVAVRELWRGRSARDAGAPPAADKGLGRFVGGLALTRWDARAGAGPDNLVLLTREEADAHDAAQDAGGAPGSAAAAALAALAAAEPELVARVRAVLARGRREFVDAYY